MHLASPFEIAYDYNKHGYDVKILSVRNINPVSFSVITFPNRLFIIYKYMHKVIHISVNNKLKYRERKIHPSIYQQKARKRK